MTRLDSFVDTIVDVVVAACLDFDFDSDTVADDFVAVHPHLSKTSTDP